MIAGVLSVGVLSFYIYCVLMYDVPFGSIPVWATVLMFLSILVLALSGCIPSNNRSDKEGN